jgi:hypothetical protein
LFVHESMSCAVPIQSLTPSFTWAWSWCVPVKSERRRPVHRTENVVFAIPGAGFTDPQAGKSTTGSIRATLVPVKSWLSKYSAWSPATTGGASL